MNNAFSSRSDVKWSEFSSSKYPSSSLLECFRLYFCWFLVSVMSLRAWSIDRTNDMLCVYFCSVFVGQQVMLQLPYLLRYSCFYRYFIHSLLIQLSSVFLSCRPDLYLIYHISSYIILWKQFNISIDVGHVERNAFATVYQSLFSSWRLRSSPGPFIEFIIQ